MLQKYVNGQDVYKEQDGCSSCCSVSGGGKARYQDKPVKELKKNIDKAI